MNAVVHYYCRAISITYSRLLASIVYELDDCDCSFVGCLELHTLIYRTVYLMIVIQITLGELHTCIC